MITDLEIAEYVFREYMIRRLGTQNQSSVIQANNPSTQEADAGGSRVQDQPGLHSKGHVSEKQSTYTLV
jgi:hypothetical protein